MALEGKGEALMAEVCLRELCFGHKSFKMYLQSF